MKSFSKYCFILIQFSATYCFSQWSKQGPDASMLASYTTIQSNKAAKNPVTGDMYVAFMDGAYSSNLSVRKFNGTGWSYVGNRGFGNNILHVFGIDFDNAGNAYIGYRDGGSFVVKKFNGTTWEDVGLNGSVGLVSGNIGSFKVDGAGIPFAAYSDFNAGNRATVKKFVSNAWTIVGSAGYSAKVVNNISLNFDEGNIPGLSYTYGELGDKRVNYNYWTGTVWQDLSPNSTLSNQITFDKSDLSIAVQNGEIFLCFKNITSGSACVFRYSTGSWSDISGMFPVALSSGTVSNMDMKVLAGVPYVKFSDATQSNKCTVKKFSSGVWSTVGSLGFSQTGLTNGNIVFDNNNQPAVTGNPSGGNLQLYIFNGTAWSAKFITGGFSAGAALNHRIVSFSNGFHYAAFNDAGLMNIPISVYSYDAGTTQTWTPVGNQSIIGNSTLLDLKVTSGGTPYIAFTDGGNSFKLYVMKFSGGNWLNEGGAVSQQSVSEASLVLNGIVPYIGYSDASNVNKARVKKFELGTWSDVVTSGISAGQASQIKIVPDGNNLFISYVDGFNGGKLSVQKYDAVLNTWTHVGSAGFTPAIDDANTYTDLTVIEGTPYVVYYDSEAPGITVQFFNTVSNAWQIIGTKGFVIPTYSSRLQLKSAGSKPYVLYNNISNQLLIKRFDGTNWVQLDEPITEGTATVEQGAVDIYSNKVTTVFSPFNATAFAKQLDISAVLPISFGKLYCIQSDGSNILNWDTHEESSLMNFQVEYSEDGKKYILLSTIEPNNTGVMKQSYSFKHISNTPKCFYRIKATEKGGTFTFSNIVSVKNLLSIKIEITPNPVQNILNIRIPNKNIETASSTITDMFGRVTKTQLFGLINGILNTSMNVSDLIPGKYYLTVHKKSGRETITFIKN